jgi:hypothetical protein
MASVTAINPETGAVETRDDATQAEPTETRNGAVYFLMPSDAADFRVKQAERDAARPARAMGIIREERNKRLMESDAVMLEDHPASAQRAAWLEYRQALRDLPSSIENPESWRDQWRDEAQADPWPTKP